MALTALSTSSSSKAIAINLGGQGSTVLYTVPTGKTFTGAVMNGSTGLTYFVLNTNNVYCGLSSTGCLLPYPVTLPAGVTFAAGTTSGILVGIEQ